MNELTRKPDESILAHHKRLVFGKLVDGTLADMDYSELSPYVYDKEYSADVARRMMYGSKRTLELMDSSAESMITSSDILSELDEKKKELHKERQRFYDQRREYNKLISEEGRMDHIFDRLAEAANSLNKTVGFLYAEKQPVVHYGDDEAILVFCDWHYGMVTDNIWNRYNTEICKERVSKIVSAAIDKIGLHGCSKLHIVLLGDLFHGGIHCSARVASEELVADQLMQVSEILAQSIQKLNQYVDETYVYATYGNHGRTIQNKKDNIHRDNMERIIPWWLKQRLRNETITIVEESDNEFIYMDVLGCGICATHGDLDSVKSSPRLLSTLFQRKFGRKVDCILLADKHHREEFEELGVSAMISGSLCGSDDYANDKRLYSTPEQLMLIINSEDGIDATYHIKC